MDLIASEYETSDDDSSSEYVPSESEQEASPEQQTRWYSLRSKRAAESSVETKRPGKIPRSLPGPEIDKVCWASLFHVAKVSLSTDMRDCLDLPQLFPVMAKINELTGLVSIKNAIANRILFYCQRDKFPPRKGQFQHIVLMGPPGCGKTTLAHLFANLFCAMSTLRTNKVVVGTRQNMIGSYVGHTAKNTQAVINEALGGVLLIDEAYALGDGRSADSSDSFSKACIDTINQNLSEKADQFVCILVGYRDELYRDFFSVNSGLERRFPWKYTLEKYTAAELCDIFIRSVASTSMSLDIPRVKLDAFFSRHYAHFIHFAASVHELTEKLELVMCRCSFGHLAIPNISLDNLEEAISLAKNSAGLKPKTNDTIATMYI